MAERKTTRKAGGITDPAWLEKALKRSKADHENLSDLVIVTLKEVLALRREVKSLGIRLARSR